MRVRKAVIPAAGRGTRLYPLTKEVPKEMLPIGERPMISYSLEEAASAGIEEVFLIVNRNKTLLIEYVEGIKLMNDFKNMEIILLEQPFPRGSGEAVFRAKEGVGDGPFALLMPDFVLFEADPPLVQMLPVFERYGKETVGVVEVKRGKEGYFGNVGILEGLPISDRTMEVRSLSGKKKGEWRIEGEGVLKAVGRWVLFPSFFDLLEETRGEGEWDDTPALQLLCRRGKVIGRLLEGEGFDVGNLKGYGAARDFLSSRRRH